MGGGCWVDKGENDFKLEIKRPSKYVGCKISYDWDISTIYHIIFKLLINFKN